MKVADIVALRKHFNTTGRVADVSRPLGIPADAAKELIERAHSRLIGMAPLDEAIQFTPQDRNWCTHLHDDDLRSAVKELDIDERQVIQRMFLLNQTADEVAEAMHMTTGLVVKLRIRALINLRERILSCTANS